MLCCINCISDWLLAAHAYLEVQLQGATYKHLLAYAGIARANAFISALFVRGAIMLASAREQHLHRFTARVWPQLTALCLQ